ncbi:hypothetical protein AALP_AAs64312U000100, partial [Arabis alpina]
EGKKTKRNPAVESDTIIGVIDSGITPESQSFSDKGFGPPPKKWKGACSGGKNFTCNNKLIGARDYTKQSARDYDGHGTHTASTAAGNAVADVSFFGIGNGTVRGGVPASRVAVYKACKELCSSQDILSAFDEAIADGVDIISISLGRETASPYEKDATAIGAFHAMAKGILTVNAAGNYGPKAGVVCSVAPWILSVAASTTNRGIYTKVVLGDGKTLLGKSVNTFDMKGVKYPLVYGKSAGFSICEEESIKFPQATILKSETIFNQTAPRVASFSSRGPNVIAVDLLKPDITAPGVEILAAYSLKLSPSQSNSDTRRVKYSLISGTSMSCPHVAGVAAYVKTFNPKWSPSMIHSAIMTTAWPMNATGTNFASTEFAYGAGHINPIAALIPGLVYEFDKADHIAFLCGLNYTAKFLKLIAGEAVTCTTENKILPRNLNYPSMSAKLTISNSSFTVTFNRTVTNVGTPNSTYKSKVVLLHGFKLNVKVSPSVLTMKSVNEKQSFTVIVTGSGLDTKMPSSAHLIWSDGTHSVRSPIVVYTDGDY